MMSINIANILVGNLLPNLEFWLKICFFCAIETSEIAQKKATNYFFYLIFFGKIYTSIVQPCLSSIVPYCIPRKVSYNLVDQGPGFSPKS